MLPNAVEPLFVFHRLNRPTAAQMVEHQNAQTSETVAAGGSGNAQQINTASTKGDELLWQGISAAVKGYDFEDGKSWEVWRILDDDSRALIPPQHRIMAINAYYQGECSLVGEEQPDDGQRRFRVGSPTLHFILKIGNPDKPDYEVDFYLKRSEETARKKFEREKSKLIIVGSGRAARTQSKLYYKAFSEYLATIIENIERATVNGQVFSAIKSDPKKRAAWLAAIDPLWALEVVNAYNKAHAASLSD